MPFVLPCLLGLAVAAAPPPVEPQDRHAGAAERGSAATEPAPAPRGEGGAFKSFLRDVGRDYRDFLSVDNAELASVGSVVGLSFYANDEDLRNATDMPTPYGLKAGATYGNAPFQFPLAVTWWIVGHASGSARGADAGRDLLRAQISAASWTYAIKYAVGRTRPNGDPRSFPSGHTSASFATAMVLQQHYGWKLGLPVFALAVYTGAERVYDNKHWASDVAFGALVGMVSGRTVTLHVRRQRLLVQPTAVPGGGGVIIHVLH